MESSEFLKVDNNIEIEKKIAKQRTYKSRPHYHNAYEINYYLDGNIDFFVRDQGYPVKKGDVLFINTYEIHNPINESSSYEKILLTYRPSFLKTAFNFEVPDIFSILDNKFNGVRLVSLSPDLQKKVEYIFGEMINISSENNKYKLILLHSYLVIFLTYITEFLSGLDSINEHSVYHNEKIRNIIFYIDQNLGKELVLGDISDRFNVNKYHLCRYFKKHTGLTIFDYINRKRILTAEKMLVTGNASITEISYMVGFNNLTHFERTFRQITGSSPRSYKKNYLNGK